MLSRRLLFTALAVMISTIIFAQPKTTVNSPSKNIKLEFWLNDQGAPMYSVSYKDKPVVLASSMGFELKQTMLNEALPAIKDNLSISSSTQTSSDTKWKPIWGDTKEIRDNYNQLAVSLSQKGDKAIKFNIIFKVFDDGVGFRYEFPKQANLNHFIVAEEKTQFHLTGDHKAFWIPGDYDSNEFSPNVTNLSEVDAEDAK